MRSVVLTLLFSVVLMGQVQNFQYPHMGGRWYAAEFAKWVGTSTTPVAAPGVFAVKIKPALLTLQGSGAVPVAAVGVPLRISDAGATELVTPAFVACGSTYCTVTAHFAFAHAYGFRVTSADSGLNEAINAAKATGGTVVLDSDWGGTAAQIADASGAPNVTVLDVRAGDEALYGWDGRSYVTSFRLSAVGGLSALSPAMTPNSIEGVIFADQPPFAKCDGVSDDSAGLQAWLNAVVATHSIGFLPAKTCAFTTPLVVGDGLSANSSWGIVGLGVASKLKYIGTRVASVLTVNGARPQSGDNLSLRFVDFAIQGNHDSVDDFDCFSCHLSRFVDLHLQDTTGVGLLAKYGEANVYENITTAQYEMPGGAWNIQQPSGCLEFDQISSGADQLNTSTVTSADCQAVSGVGIYVKSSQNLVFNTPEIQAATGFRVDQGSFNIELNGATLEDSGTDVVDNGSRDLYLDDLFTNGIELGSGSRTAEIMGGAAGGIQVDSGAIDTAIIGLTVVGSGAITDNGTNTQFGYALPSSGNGFAAVSNWRHTVPSFYTAAGFRYDPLDELHGHWEFTTATRSLSNTEFSTGGGRWVLIFEGVWADDADGGNLAQPGSVVEINDVSPSVAVGSEIVTFSMGDSSPNHLSARVADGAAKVYFSGRILVERSAGASSLDGPGMRLAGSAYLGGGATLPSGRTLAATGAKISGGSVNADSLQEGGVPVALVTRLPFAAVTGQIAPGSVSPGSCYLSVPIPVPGATTSMAVAASPEVSLGLGFTWSAWVSAAARVELAICNVTAAPSSPSTTRWNIRVIQ